jgi:L-lysine exporter family protein LysE/ArgO
MASLFPGLIALFLQGLGTGAGLIIAIGAQNAFVLRQGLKREQVFIVALISTLGDCFLIALGLLGVGSLLNSLPLLTLIATLGGALFLFVFGLRSFRAALRGLSNGPLNESALTEDATNATVKRSRRAMILTAMAFSVLNPHVYLDTVVVIGGIGAKFPLTERLVFGFGAASASTVWFFGLGYGARWLAPLFARAITWRILDGVIGVIMWLIALSLLLGSR